MSIPVDKITIVSFVVFNSDDVKRNDPDKGVIERPFYNCTPEQCVKFIRKNIWETAQIKKIVEYYITSPGQIHNVNVVDLNMKMNNEDHSKQRK